MTNNKLRVDMRVDRALLVSAYESSRQIYSVCVWDFGDLPAKPSQPARLANDHPLVQKAWQSFKPAFELYAKGELSLEEFKKQATDNLEKVRSRKTPMGKIGLARFLECCGHPAPWAKDCSDGPPKKVQKTDAENAPKAAPKAAKPPEADKNPKATEEPPKATHKNRNAAVQAANPGEKPDAQSAQTVAKTPNDVFEVADEDDTDLGRIDREASSAASYLGLQHAEGISSVARQRLLEMQESCLRLEHDED